MTIYATLVGVGVVAALAYTWWQMRDTQVLNTFLIIGVCAGVAGRLGYLALYQPPNGELGLQAHAALLGGWLGHTLVWRLNRPVLPILPAVCLIALAGHIGIGASLGCIPNACGYGREVFWTDGGDRTLAWALRVDWPDAYTIQNPRLPTQLFAAGGVVVMMGVAALLQRKADANTRAHADWLWPAWLATCAVGDFWLQGLRADVMPMWQGLRAEQWLDGALLLVMLIFMSRLFLQMHMSKPALSKGG